MRTSMRLSSRITAMLLCLVMIVTTVWNENLVVKAAYDDEVVVSNTNLVPNAFEYADGAFTNCKEFFADQSTYESVTVNAETGTGDGSEGVDGIKFTFNGATLGADYTNGIKYTGMYGENTSLTSGKTYQISYKVLSTVDRKIMSGFDAGQGRDQMVKTQLTADTVENVSYLLTAGGAWYNYFFYFGTIDDENALGEHELTIWDFVINEVTTNPKDGTPVEETAGNLLTNGTFKNGNTDGWEVSTLNATATPVAYRVLFDFNGTSADWQTWMTQNVTLDAGSTYNIQMDVSSSIERTVLVGFDNGIGRLEAKTVPAGLDKTTTLEWEVTNSTGGKFAIYLGTNIGDAHRVSISNVRITQAPVDLGDKDTENDTYPTPMTGSDLKSLSGYVSSDLSVIKNGSFKSGLENWETYMVDWMAQWSVTSFKPVEEGMQISIGNTGAANNAYDVQLNQKIDLKKDLEYTLSFDITSNKARSINVVIPDIDNGNAWVKPIGLQPGEKREVVLELPVLAENAVDKLFSFQMGQVNDFEVTDNVILIEDVKIEVHGYQDLAERVVDGNFDDGLGDFAFEGNGIATCDTSDKSVKIDVAGTLARAAEDITLSKDDIALLGGQTYRFSFVAGDVNAQPITVNVKGNDDSVKKTQNYTLGNEIKEYSFTYAPAADETVSLEFVIGNVKNTVCFDTIRCDINGYAEAAGIDTGDHDITALDKFEAPLISEASAADAYVGQDIVLTYENDAAFTDAIDSVTINGMEIYGSGNVTITEGAEKTTVTLDKSLFTVEEDSEIFEIKVGAYWYDSARVLQTVYKEDKWSATWLEEFDGTALDTTKWGYQNGTGTEYGVPGWGNNEQQYYTDENITVADGALTIVAEKDNSKGTKYTSGRIWTMNDDQKSAKFSQKYGRMEAKIKVPGGEGYEGIWPAFWMLPVDTSIYGGWPLSGEIDIMEIRGRLPDEVDGTIHYGKDYPNNENSGNKYEFSKSVYNQDSDVNDYHVYALEWEPGEIRWYVDGELYSTKNNWYSQSSKNPTEFAYPAPFDQQFYIILNLAVGGAFDGNLEPSADNLPAEMVVDYVRVYESVDGYDENVSKPGVEKDPSVDVTEVKSNIIDPNFENVTVITADGQAQDPTGWNFVTLPTFGGAATFSTVEEGDDTLAKIDITNGGSQAYSIQLIQNLALAKGYCYKLSFDAKADESRKMAVKFGDVGDSGWGTYATYEANLGTDLQHYEYSFQMLADTDLTSRVEFNWGTNTTTGYIGNITLEIVDSVSMDYDSSKPALFDDNQLYNGNFTLGDASRLAYWHVSEDGDGAVEVADGVNKFKATKGALYQKGIQLLQSDSYEMTFDAEADAAKNITVTVKNDDGSVVYKTETLNIAAGSSKPVVTFVMEEGVTDLNAVVELAFEDTAAEVKVSDIRLVKTSYNNVDWDSLNSYPLTNGDFELGDDNWTQYGGAGFTVVEDPTDAANHVAKVNGANGGDAWANMLIYDGLELAGGYTYEFAFDAWADSAQNILITMEDGSYTSYFTASDVAIGTEKDTYNYSFKLDTNQTVALKFQFGNGDGAYTAYIDNVKLNMKGAPAAPGSVGTDAINYANKDLVLTLIGTEEWKNAIKVYVNSEAVDTEFITVDGDTLTIDKSLFDKEGTYKITLKAAGYAGANVTVYLYPANGNLVVNGGFQNTVDPMGNWGYYIQDGSGAVEVEDGRLKVDYLYGWKQGEVYVPWNISFNQENITVEEGKTYEIAFIADSEIERPIMVSTDQGAGEVHQYLTLEEGEHVYKVTFTSTSNKLNKLLFQVGTVGSAEQYNAPAAFDAHTMYFDSISVRELEDGQTTVPVYTEDLTNMIAEVEAMEKGNYTDNSWANLQAVLVEVKAAADAIDENTTQPEVDRIRDALQEAIDQLKTKADMTQLATVIAEAEALVEEDYTEATWSVLANALKAAKELVADTNVSEQSQVNNMVARLQAAIKGLEKIQNDEPGTNEGDDEDNKGTNEGADEENKGTNDGGTGDMDDEPGTSDGNDRTGIWIKKIAPQEYTGSAIKVKPEVYDGEDLLTLNKDYTISYKKNKTVGEATVIIKGKGNYKGKYEAQFQIVGKDITEDGETLYGVLKNKTKLVTVKPALKVTMANGKTKKLGKKDYTIEYKVVDKDGKEGTFKAGELYNKESKYFAVVTGKGNYAGTATYPITFVENKNMLMKNAKITLEYKSVEADEKQKTPKVVVKAGGKEVPAEQYTVSYGENINAGKGTVKVAGDEKNMFGYKDVAFTIKGVNIKKVAQISGVKASVDYTGEAITQNIEVKAGEKVLAKGTDYLVTYKNNVKPGKATITVTGIGQYSGKMTATFKINKVALNEADVTLAAEAPYSKAGAKAVNLVVKAGDKVLVEGVDYKVTYKKNKKAGETAEFVVTGKGGYTGKVPKTFKVVAADFAKAVVVDAQDAVIGTKYSKLKVTAKDGNKKLTKKEYKVEYYVDGQKVSDANAKIEKQCDVTVRVIANSDNYVKETYVEDTVHVAANNISKAKVKVNDTLTYTGKAVEPTNLTVTVAGNDLKLGTDYVIVGYGNNVNQGSKATVTIQGIGEYCGTKTVKFAIGQQDITEKVTEYLKAIFEWLF